MNKTGKLILAVVLALVTGYAWAGVTAANNSHGTTPNDPKNCGGCGTSHSASPTSNNPTMTAPASPTAGGAPTAGNTASAPGQKGMPVYSFMSLLASLNIQDTPIGYTPPVGPKVETTLTYNEREADQPATFDAYNLGHKWTLNWLTYIQDDPSTPGARVLRYVAGGGGEVYTGYNASTGTFAPEEDNGARLVMTSSNPITYELRFSDGHKDIFSVSDGKTTYPRKVFLSKIIGPHGNSISLSYDAQLRLTTVTDAIGQKTTFQYADSADPLLVTSITDPFGRSAKIGYDSQGRLISITDQIGMTSTFAYDSGTFVKSMTTPYGTTTFAHTEGANGNATELSIQATDPEGYTERTEYLPGAPGMPFSVSRAPSGMNVFNAWLNYRDSYYWDKDAYAAACTDSSGHVSCDYSKAKMEHFAHQYPCCYYTSRVIEDVKYPLESMIWYDYAGQQGSIYPGKFNGPSHIGRVLPDGTTQRTSYTYNDFGRITRMVDPAGRETDYTYASNGIDLLEVQQRTSTGYATLARYTYNSQHEPLTYTDAAGQTTTYTYNARGERTSVTDPLGHTTTFTYDSDGYLTTATNALGNVQHSYTYDAYGRLASDTDSKGYTRRYRYDALDRLTQISYPDGTRQTYVWNKLDLASITDRMGNTTTFTYDHDRNLIAMTNAMGRVTRYTYYPNGKLHTLTGPDGNTTTWTRDLEGRVVAKSYSDGSQTTYAYDSADRLISKTDALGQVTRFAYTVADRLASMSYENAQNPTPSVSFTYDSTYPRVTAMTDGQGTTQFSYYPVGVLGANALQSEQGPDQHDRIVYAYDALNRLASRTVDGAQETFTYDALGRRTGDDNALGKFTTAYLGDTAQPTLRTIAGVAYQVAYRYQSNFGDRRLKAILNETLFHGVPRPVADYTFTSNDDGLFVSRTENDGLPAQNGDRQRGWDQGRHQGWDHAPHWGVLTQLFGGTDPDESHRSGPGQASAHDEDYGQEDNQGDRGHGDGVRGLATQYTYDAVLRLTDAQGGNSESYAYDPAGNITEADTTSGSTSFAINGLNQIETANGTNYTYNADGELVDDGAKTYRWDAAGRLIEITNEQTGHISQFSYDGFGRRVTDTETDPSGTPVTVHFLWCGLRMCEKRDASDTVLARYYAQGEIHGGQPFYYAQDQAGSVTALVDASGAVVGRLSYDSYGNITNSSGMLPDYRYAGLYYHQATGLDLATYRLYDPPARRWISRDPMREAGGVNLYAYAANSPIGLIDTLGLCPTCSAAQKQAAHLAEAFENAERLSEALAVGSGLGTALSGAGEGPSFGFDTPVTVSFGAATTFFSEASFFSGAAAAALNSFASGNLNALGNFDFNKFLDMAATALAAKVPGVSEFASDIIGKLVGQGASLAEEARKACQ